MSYDLMAFEPAKAPVVYGDFLEWMAKQTQWDEDRDYNSIAGTEPKLASWFMEAKQTFPPLNGEYSPSDDELCASEEIENHLTDYSIGSDIIYAAFGWSVAKQAERLMGQLCQKHGLGLYNPQTGELHSDGMVLCKMSTESYDDKTVVWEHIEAAIQTLADPARGTTHRDGAFLTVFFTENGTDDEFMQCMPDYPKPQGFFKKLLGAGETTPITKYTVEISAKEKIYTKQVEGPAQVSQLFYDYYKSRRLPDSAGWTDSGIL